MANSIVTRIYGLVDPRDGKVFYIGRTKQLLRRRLDSHKKDGRHKKTLKGLRIAEINAAGFKVEIIEIVKYFDLSKEEVIATEQAWIDFYSITSKILNSQEARATFHDGWTGDRCVLWSSELIARLGKEPDTEIAAFLNCNKSTVSDKRNALGIPVYKGYEWTEDKLILLGKKPDSTLANLWGIHRSTITTKRNELGIHSCPSSNWYDWIDWTPELLARLGKESDAKIARSIGVSCTLVRRKRKKLNIAAWKKKAEWTSEIISRLGKEPDAVIGRELGIGYQDVSRQRVKRSIPRWTKALLNK